MVDVRLSIVNGPSRTKPTVDSRMTTSCQRTYFRGPGGLPSSRRGLLPSSPSVTRGSSGLPVWKTFESRRPRLRHSYSGTTPDSVVLSSLENLDGCGRYPLRVRTLYFFS